MTKRGTVCGIDVGLKKCGFAIIKYSTDDTGKITYQLEHVEAISVPENQNLRRMSNAKKCELMLHEFIERRDLVMTCTDICIEMQIDHLVGKKGGKTNGLMHTIENYLTSHFLTLGFKDEQIHRCSGVSKLALQVQDGVKSTVPKNMKYVQRKELVRVKTREFCKEHPDFDGKQLISPFFFKKKTNPTVYDQCDAMAHALAWIQRTLGDHEEAQKKKKDKDDKKKKKDKKDKKQEASSDDEKTKDHKKEKKDKKDKKKETKKRKKTSSSSEGEDMQAVIDDSDLPENIRKKLKGTAIGSDSD